MSITLNTKNALYIINKNGVYQSKPDFDDGDKLSHPTLIMSRDDFIKIHNKLMEDVENADEMIDDNKYNQPPKELFIKKRLSDFTLDDIAAYLEHCGNDDLSCFLDSDDDELVVERFDGEYDMGIFVCSIGLKDTLYGKDFYINTGDGECMFNHGDAWCEDEGFENFLLDENDANYGVISIKTLVAALLTSAKGEICEQADIINRNIKFLNSFRDKCGLNITPCVTCRQNEYE